MSFELCQSFSRLFQKQNMFVRVLVRIKELSLVDFTVLYNRQPSCYRLYLNNRGCYICIYVCVYTGCPRRNVKYFRRVFLMLNYTDKTQNTYIQS